MLRGAQWFSSAALGAARAECGLSWIFLAVLLVIPTLARGVEFEAPLQDPHQSITVRAEHSKQWQEGEYEVWLLHGGCELRQGKLVARCRDAVLWIDRADPLSQEPNKIIAYFETDVWMTTGDEARRASGDRSTPSRQTTEMNLGKSWLGRFTTSAQIAVSATDPMGDAGEKPPIYGRGVEALGWHQRTQIQAAQFAEPLPSGAPAIEQLPVPGQVTSLPTARQVNIIPRSSLGTQVNRFPGTTPDESIVTVTGGVRVVVSGIEGIATSAEIPVLPAGAVMIEADRIVAWTTALAGLGLGGQGSAPSNSGRWEIYLEGNIVFREGERVIYADRMYYNVNENRGTVLNAEMLTPVPGYEGLLRLKADVIQQLDQQNFQANGAALTSSRLGVPRYWLQSETMTLNLQDQPRLDPLTRQPLMNAQTGQPLSDTAVLATSRNNFIYVGGVPIFYWPVAATDATKPTFYIDGVRLSNDSIFGSQIYVDWDTYQVFGRQPIEGTKWTFSTDYLSDRGVGLGTYFKYQRDSFLGFAGETFGTFDAWGIQDEGLDNLGADRLALFPEQDYRGRVLWQHRQRFQDGYQLTAELGAISDRNFLEQYYEREWDQNKDQATGIELKRLNGNSSWALSADARINDFFTETENLPRFDHFLIGQSLFGGLAWHSHSLAAYEHLQTATPPSAINPGEVALFNPLAWEADREGAKLATRQEVDWPIQLGSVKVVPYVLGEAAYWGEDLSGEEVKRLYGQTGIRASLPFWRTDPMVTSTLFNLNGLAHKVVFDAELSYSDAAQDLDQFPLYEQIDDNSTEAFRRRMYVQTYGGPAVVGGPNNPLKFDERYFALRSGMQSWVTAPSMEIVDDLMYARFGVRQRWQTKRGLPGQERIVDWIVLDVEGTYFPKAERDNFGEEVGLLNYDFRWHVGDRLTLLSDGFADLFDEGLRTFTMGASINRPERGNLYLGYRSLDGPISGNILMGSLSYRMTDKWIATGGATFDFGNTGNIGQNFQLTRVGESALVRLGFIHDASRDNLGVNLTIEPRFLPSGRLGRVGGVHVPPAGALGLE